jgi:dTDP-4-amino-4,6-dideoxygalactose transaminase
MKTIPFARVSCDGNELAYIREVLESGWLTTASKAQEFERRFADMVKASHACAVNSCTAALHLALEALGVGPGNKVMVPSMTFTASAEVIRYLNADPVLIDVDYGTRMVTPKILKQALDRNGGAETVKALVLLHFGGQAAPMYEENGNGILSLCRENGI